jgi:hypothetical protein
VQTSCMIFEYFMTTQWHFTTRPTSAYEDTWIYYNINCVDLLHVLVTLWPFSGTCFYEGYITKTNKPTHKYKILNFKYVIHNTC